MIKIDKTTERVIKTKKRKHLFQAIGLPRG